jgi:putative PIN family toxin of toxin-antitoxin system
LLKAFRFCDLCASTKTLAEIEEVIYRCKFDRYLNREERRDFMANLHRRASIFVVQNADAMAVDPPCRDSKDNQFLALARVAEANLLISSDEDLLVLHPWRGLQQIFWRNPSSKPKDEHTPNIPTLPAKSAERMGHPP